MLYRSFLDFCRVVWSTLGQFVLLIGVSVTSNPVFAGLPSFKLPTGIADPGKDDWIGTMKAWFQAGLAALGLILVALLLIKVVVGGISKWTDYTKGRADIGELKEYMIMGVILVIFCALLIGYVTTVFSA